MSKNPPQVIALLGSILVSSACTGQQNNVVFEKQLADGRRLIVSWTEIDVPARPTTQRVTKDGRTIGYPKRAYRYSFAIGSKDAEQSTELWFTKAWDFGDERNFGADWKIHILNAIVENGVLIVAYHQRGWLCANVIVPSENAKFDFMRWAPDYQLLPIPAGYPMEFCTARIEGTLRENDLTLTLDARDEGHRVFALRKDGERYAWKRIEPTTQPVRTN